MKSTPGPTSEPAMVAQRPITQQFFIFCSNVAGGPNSTTSTLKAARAALMLIPILGIHFILLPIRPEQGSTLEYVYEVVSAVSSSYQVKAKTYLFLQPNKMGGCMKQRISINI